MSRSPDLRPVKLGVLAHADVGIPGRCLVAGACGRWESRRVPRGPFAGVRWHRWMVGSVACAVAAAGIGAAWLRPSPDLPWTAAQVAQIAPGKVEAPASTVRNAPARHAPPGGDAPMAPDRDVAGASADDAVEKARARAALVPQPMAAVESNPAPMPSVRHGPATASAPAQGSSSTAPLSGSASVPPARPARVEHPEPGGHPPLPSRPGEVVASVGRPNLPGLPVLAEEGPRRPVAATPVSTAARRPSTALAAPAPSVVARSQQPPARAVPHRPSEVLDQEPPSAPTASVSRPRARAPQPQPVPRDAPAIAPSEATTHVHADRPPAAPVRADTLVAIQDVHTVVVPGPRGVPLPVRVGAQLPSGARLLSVDPATGQAETDRGRIRLE